MSSQSTTQDNSLSGETQLSPSRYGNTSDQSQEPDTFKVTSNLVKQSGSSELQDLLAKARTLSPEEARSWKPLPTAPKKTRVSKGHGHMVRQHPGKASEAIWIRSPDELQEAQPYEQSLKKLQERSRGITEDFGLSKKSRTSQHGVKYGTSTSSARQMQESLRSFTKYSDTMPCTLWQAKKRAGSTGMKANLFYSLTSIKDALTTKHSMRFWMAILTDLQSKAGLSALATVLELLSPILENVRAGPIQQSDGSTPEDSSNSQDDMYMEDLTSQDGDSASGSTDEESSPETWSSSRVAQCFDDEAEEDQGYGYRY